MPVEEATLIVTALASRLEPSLGFVPLNITVNGRSLTHRWTIPGGGGIPQANVFAVPGQWLRPGPNLLSIANADDARSRLWLWLYRVTLDPMGGQGRSERVLAARHAEEAVFRCSRPHR